MTLKPANAPGAEARQRFLEAHLGVQHTEHTIVSRQYPRQASNQVLVALEDVLQKEPFQISPPVDYDDDEGQRAPRYRSVPVSPGQTRAVLEEGYYPAHYGSDKVPLVVGVGQRDQLEVWVHLRVWTAILLKCCANDTQHAGGCRFDFKPFASSTASNARCRLKSSN